VNGLPIVRTGKLEALFQGRFRVIDQGYGYLGFLGCNQCDSQALAQLERRLNIYSLHGAEKTYHLPGSYDTQLLDLGSAQAKSSAEAARGDCGACTAEAPS